MDMPNFNLMTSAQIEDYYKAANAVKPVARTQPLTIEHFDEFTAAMHAKLARNRHKVGTPRGNLEINALLDFLKIEVKELEAAIRHLPLDEALDECVDVAAFCMLLHKRVSQRLVK
jgi:hypothetical protein